ncbi:putative mitochondrial protein AtMg00310 [Apium graveolens]|uniref:putative mitochondrial protein AtMg00310 n=1 Tax=Apium graveolens TaxID=4045 RepID=UPI003D794A18
MGRNKVASFGFLHDRVEQKLQVWGNQTLSKAGKITFLKTAAQSIPNFWMNLLLIPGEVCEKIERRMNAFWWGNRGTGRGIKWMAWERMCTIKEDEGLGFKSLKSFNIAMLAKQGWRLLNNVDPLVTSMMKAKYFPDSDFLDAKIGVNPSYM